MRTKIDKVIQLAANIYEAEGLVQSVKCLMGDMRVMRSTLDDLAEKIAERKKAGSDGPIIRLSEIEQLKLSNNLIDLDRVLKMADNIMIEEGLFHIDKIKASEITDDPDSFYVEEINDINTRLEEMIDRYPDFIADLEALDKELLQSISSVTIGGKPYLDIGGIL